ncbi:MAG: helix-turn-helix transcriptional regulator [Nitrospirae bacterium]|nr:helix-turn-helix transcriptional regulator [Nitrospirota bacterium]
MGSITKYNDDGSVTHYDSSGNVQFPGTADKWSPDMPGTSGSTPMPTDNSTPFNTPPLSDAAKQYAAPASQPSQPALKGPDVSGIVPDMPGTSGKTPIPDIVDDNLPGTGSQLPGVKDPYMQKKYAQNEAAADRLNKILAGMPNTVGDGGWGALNSMFGVVLQLAKGVGQKNLAGRELANAQQQLQEHEQHQALASYYSGKNAIGQQNADSKSQNANSAAKKVDNQAAYNQKSLDLRARALDLRQQWLDGQITNQDYANQLKQIQIDMLNPQAICVKLSQIDFNIHQEGAMALLGHDYFKALRKRKGFSLRELEKRSGVSYSQIKAIEDGKKMPGLDTFYDLCNGLDISIFEYFEHVGISLYRPGRLNLVPKDAADRERIRKISVEGVDGMAVQGFEPRA